jgi:hexokinase
MLRPYMARPNKFLSYTLVNVGFTFSYPIHKSAKLGVGGGQGKL